MNGAISKAWLDQRFDKLDRANVAILASLDVIQDRTALILVELRKITSNNNISPELEDAIRKVSAQAMLIDRKVPDVTLRQNN